MLAEPQAVMLEPLAAVKKNITATSLHSSRPSIAELDDLQWGKALDGPSRSRPPTPRQLEHASRDEISGTPLEQSTTNVVGILPRMRVGVS